MGLYFEWVFCQWTQSQRIALHQPQSFQLCQLTSNFSMIRWAFVIKLYPAICYYWGGYSQRTWLPVLLMESPHHCKHTETILSPEKHSCHKCNDQTTFVQTEYISMLTSFDRAVKGGADSCCRDRGSSFTGCWSRVNQLCCTNECPVTFWQYHLDGQWKFPTRYAAECSHGTR